MAKAKNVSNEGPVDHGDGKPAVDLPPGSYDSSALDAAVSAADHNDAESVMSAVASARTDVAAPAEEEAAEVTGATDLNNTADADASAEVGKAD